MGFDQQFLEKTMKNMIFHDFLLVWGLALGSFDKAMIFVKLVSAPTSQAGL